MPARQTLAAKGNCFVLSVGNQDILPKNAFQIDFPPKERGKESVHQTTSNGKVKQHLCWSCLSKHPSSGKRVADGSHGSKFHRKLLARAVSNFVTVPVILHHGSPTVAVKIQGAKRNLIVDSGSSCSLLQPGVAEIPLESTTFETFGVTGDSLDIVGEQQVLFQMVRVTFSHSFWFANCQHPRMALLDWIFWRRERLDWP